MLGSPHHSAPANLGEGNGQQCLLAFPEVRFDPAGRSDGRCVVHAALTRRTGATGSASRFRLSGSSGTEGGQGRYGACDGGRDYVTTRELCVALVACCSRYAAISGCLWGGTDRSPWSGSVCAQARVNCSSPATRTPRSTSARSRLDGNVRPSHAKSPGRSGWTCAHESTTRSHPAPISAMAGAFRKPSATPKRRSSGRGESPSALAPTPGFRPVIVVRVKTMARAMRKRKQAR